MSSNIWCTLALAHTMLSIHYLEAGKMSSSNWQGFWMCICLIMAVWLDWREHHGKNL